MVSTSHTTTERIGGVTMPRMTEEEANWWLSPFACLSPLFFDYMLEHPKKDNETFEDFMHNFTVHITDKNNK